jgi:hypothetical protein
MKRERRTITLRGSLAAVLALYPALVCPSGATAEKPDSQRPPATCGGRVLDERGEPIRGATVQVFWMDSPGHLTSQEGKTDAEGRWQVAIPLEVRDVDIHLVCPGYISDESFRREAPSLAQLRAGTSVMVMKKGTELPGVVRSEDGKPIENALVLPHGRYATTAEGAAVEDSTTARTTADGRFLLRGLEAGPRELTVTATGFGPESVPVDVQAGMATVEVVMHPGGILQGRVLDPEGKPVAGAALYSRRWELRGSHILSLTTRTDAEGGFQMTDVPRAGSLDFYISKKGYLPPDDTIYLPQTEPYEITLYPPPVIAATVVDDETGRPVTEFELTDGIRWAPDDPVSWYATEWVRSAEGAFRRKIDRFIVRRTLPACAVRILAQGYIPETTPPVTVGGKTEPFVVRLHKGQPWTGYLRDAAGRPASGAEVAWLGPERIAFIKNGRIQPGFVRGPEWVVRTDPNGRFELPPSRTGGRILALHDAGYGLWPSDGFTRDSSVRLTAWARVEGTIHIAGAENHTAQIRMEPADQPTELASPTIRWTFAEVSHVNGDFAFDYVPALRLAIGCILDEKFSLAEYLTPQPGQTSRVEIKAGRPGLPPARSLVGSALPEMKNITVAAAVEQTQGKPVLLCFFDVNQRPSRRCVEELGKRTPELKTRGVLIAAVQAGEDTGGSLATWAKATNLPMPVGTIRGNLQQMKATWGVQALPWLILTDGNHVVTAEGFALSVLDEKLGAMTERETP